MEQLLDKASQIAQQAETLNIKEESVHIHYEAREIKKIETKNTSGVSLRLIKDGRIGTTGGTFPLERDQIVAQALTSAKYSDKVEYTFPSGTPGQVKTYDKKVAQLSIEEMRSIGETLLKEITRRAPEIIPDLSISKSIEKMVIANSNGLKSEYDKTLYSIGMGSRIKGSKASVEKWDASGKYFQFSHEKIDDLVKEYGLCDIKCSIPTKKMPVIFTPQSAWSLLYRLYAAISGDAVYREISPLGTKIGTKIFDERINIFDDPTMDFGIQSCPFDDEGVPTYRKKIIEKGILRNFIFDLHSAAKKKTRSTGNGFKRGLWGGGIATPPSPGVANLTLAPGKMSRAEMIKDIKEGIIVDEVMGFHSGNIIQGEFSMSVGVGYLIQNGVVKGRAMDAMVAGNIYDSFNNLIALGDKVEISYLGYLPAMYFKDMSVAGKGDSRS